MLNFQPKTDEEIKKEMIIPEGFYSFQVLNAIEKVSKNGNPMIELIITIWGDTGKSYQIYDYLMTNHPTMLFKLKHFCYSSGLQKEYEDGRISDLDCKDCEGKLLIKHRKDKNGELKARVDDYCIDQSSGIKDDDINF